MTGSDRAAWRVHKFGGSSVADAACFERVAQILEASPDEKLAVVLSACRGVTDALYRLVLLAEQQQEGVRGELDALRARHATVATTVLDAKGAKLWLAAFDRDCHDLEGILNTVRLTRSAAGAVRDAVVGYGELWSTRLFCDFLAHRGVRRGAIEWVDARKVLVVEWGALGPAVQWAESKAKLAPVAAAAGPRTLIITGFIASSRNGVQTTLGRNGSDFSASIFGSLLDAAEIVIWTDVDGVLSADPRRVPDARVIDALSYSEAMELAYFGAKVIHPQTMAPAVGRGIPIWIRNTFAPARAGTLICAQPQSGMPVKGITSIDQVALLNVEGAGMIGVPGTAHRLFGALREADISVIVISQGSSEHSICCAVPGVQADRAVQAVREAFARELADGQIQSVDVDHDLAILAVVGDGMAGMPGVSAKVFNALGASSVNVRAIAQGASERNISVVVGGRDATRALRAVHAGFYLSPHTLSIGVIGPGTVGQVFLDQVAAQAERLRDLKLDLRVRGILASKTMVLSDTGLPLDRWRETVKAHSTTADLARFVEHVHVDYLPHSVIIDCTASAEVAARYREWLAAGIHVVTPNKKANSGDLTYYRDLQATRRLTGAHYLYETTVGAGLPIVQTLRDLRDTGDGVRCIEGIFSGTLAWLFNVYDGSVPFSQIVADAKQRGYTEPDPRDDLSGTDVARKLIILGRELGLGLELADVKVESLVPNGLERGTIDEFMQRLPASDAAMQARFAAAKARGKVLRYVGRLTAEGEATVGVVEVEGRHAFANIALTDNIVRFATARYSANPLIVQGPGAGPEVTAGGVFADLLRLSAYLGARL
ncbi:MAG TPA: bifunctional aspartate kinase/homoserine dehydrogenase I [Steroidobacteraceae bacterium]|nr:bifunctional aspartate kinase/homoserine dehydrogenase I [Steroidobacteraceae bacterium]HQZ79104.1 bifunctional aspartate kinase/homoserine dehydrogenase I [Steroidobacteraceae bacterium]